MWDVTITSPAIISGKTTLSFKIELGFHPSGKILVYKRNTMVVLKVLLVKL